MIFPFFLAYHAYALPSQPCIIQFQFLPSVKMGEGADSVISSRFLLVLRKEDFQVHNLLFFSPNGENSYDGFFHFKVIRT